MISFLTLPKFIFFNRVPPSLKQWIRPLLLLSIGVHAAILMIPIPESPLAVKPKPTEKPRSTVKIKAISTAVKPKSIVAQVNAPQPQLQSKMKASKYVLPTPVQKEKSAPVKRSAKPNPPSKDQNSKTSSPTSKSTAPSDGTLYDPKNLWSDFPQFPGAQPNYLDLPSCFSTAQSLKEVTQFFEKQLSAKKYKVKSVSAVNAADRKIYKIERDRETQFLNIFLDSKTTLYVKTEKPVDSLNDLKNAIQIPPEFYSNILGQLSASADNANKGSVTPDQFAKPKDFYLSLGEQDEFLGTKTNPVPKVDTDSDFKFAKGQTPQQLFETFFKPKLSELKYQSILIPNGYSGGILYEVSKSISKPFYLNLVPTEDKTGTIIVVWKNKPT